MPHHSLVELPQRVEVASETAGRTTWIRVQGEIDMASIAAVEDPVRAALGAAPERLVLSLEGVSFLESTCIRLLANTARGAKAADVEFVLLPPRGHAVRALDIVGTSYAR